MTGAPRHGSTSLVRAVPPVERLDRDGEAVALVGTAVVRLSALAVVVLDTCWPASVRVEDLAAVLVERFGQPGDGAETDGTSGDAVAATLEVLEALAAQGLVELRTRDQPPV